MQRSASLRRLLALSRPEWGRLAIGTVALLFTSGLGLAYPLFVKDIVDGVLDGGGRETIDRLALTLLGLFALAGIFTAVRAYLFTVAGEHVVAQLRQRLYSVLVRQEVAFFDEHR